MPIAWLLRLGAICSFAILLAVAPAESANAGPPGENGVVVHVAGEEGAVGGDIYAITPDGSSSRLVAAGRFSNLDVSPDATTVLATELQTNSDREGAIVVIDLATGAKETVIESGAVSAVWSGDGITFAYTDADGKLWVVEGSGEERQIFLVGWNSVVWDWSPVDDRVLVSQDDFDGFAYVRLDSIDTETEEVVNLVSTTEDVQFSGGDFSPEGKKVVYGSTLNGSTRIDILNDDEGPVAQSGTDGGPTGPVTWSPDGKKIAFPRTTATGHQMVIYTVASDEKAVFDITGTGSLDWAPTASETSGPFVDVPVDHIFSSAISWLADEGITRGCNPPDNTRFCPADFVTRGQVAAFLARAFGYTDDGGGDHFVDDDSSVFENDIDRLAAAGVTLGCNPPDNTRFCPADFVTRGQMAAFLERGFTG
jgi:hypothetical protein